MAIASALMGITILDWRNGVKPGSHAPTLGDPEGDRTGHYQKLGVAHLCAACRKVPPGLATLSQPPSKSPTDQQGGTSRGCRTKRATLHFGKSMRVTTRMQYDPRRSLGRVRARLCVGREERKSMSPNDLQSRIMLINIDLRWDGGRRVVVGAVGRFHLPPSQYPYAEVKGLRITYDELDWNDLRNQLYEQLSRTSADASSDK